MLGRVLVWGVSEQSLLLTFFILEMEEEITSLIMVLQCVLALFIILFT